MKKKNSLLKILKLVFPMLDHVLDDLHVLFFLGLEVFIHPSFPDFFIRIRGGIFQEGLVILNRIFLAHEGLVQHLEPGLYGALVFFSLVHFDILINIFKIMNAGGFLELYSKTL